ncbi:MAG: TonB family protein [Leptolyngbyaceae bacterium]|nr:TonB family protein [Leptolyngbyaceae bacterium]
MSLSSTASQQRDRQTRLSHPLFAWGVAGSLVFHGGMLPAIFLLARQDAPPEPAQIEVVFTEPAEPIPEEEPEPAVFEEETQENVPTPAQVEPQPTPSTPEATEDVPDDVVEDVSEPDVSEPDAVTEQPSSLDNLLADIRQRRPSNAQRNRAPASSENASPSGSSNSSQSGGGEEVATRPSAPPSRPGPRTVSCRSCPKPSYPRSALDAGAEGTVNIMVDINANGNVTSATLVGSSGNSALDQAALSAVRNRWRFQPIRGGASGVVVSVVMTIQGSDLNRRASEQGDRQSVEVPSSDLAEEENGDTPTASSSDESSTEDSPNATSSPQSDEAPQNDGAQTGSEADTTPTPAAESSSPEPTPQPTSESESPSVPAAQPDTPEAPGNNESSEPSSPPESEPASSPEE